MSKLNDCTSSHGGATGTPELSLVYRDNCGAVMEVMQRAFISWRSMPKFKNCKMSHKCHIPDFP